MNARERLRKAVGAWVKECGPASGWNAYARKVKEAVEALLAETPATGTWAWAVEQMRQGRKVRRRSWGYREATLYALNGDSVVWVESCDQYRLHLTDIDATDWELLPTAHKPCPFCGDEAVVGNWPNHGLPHVMCSRGCAKGPDCTSEAEAWRLWDRRA